MKYTEILTVQLPYDEIIRKVLFSEPFDFARYGDGEMECMWHKRGRPMNSDLHTYFPALGEAMVNVLKSQPQKDHPNYYLGLQRLGYDQNQAVVQQFTKDYSLSWCFADVFHKASIRGRMEELIDCLNTRDVLLIGNSYLSKLNWHQLEVPLKNAWTEYEAIKEYIAAHIHPEMVVVYCCGMMASVLVDDFKGQATQIDAGSCFDPYCGYMSRGYHFELPVPDGQASEYYKARGK